MTAPNSDNFLMKLSKSFLTTIATTSLVVHKSGQTALGKVWSDISDNATFLVQKEYP